MREDSKFRRHWVRKPKSLSLILLQKESELSLLFFTTRPETYILNHACLAAAHCWRSCDHFLEDSNIVVDAVGRIHAVNIIHTANATNVVNAANAVYAVDLIDVVDAVDVPRLVETEQVFFPSSVISHPQLLTSDHVPFSLAGSRASVNEINTILDATMHLMGIKVILVELGTLLQEQSRICKMGILALEIHYLAVCYEKFLEHAERKPQDRRGILGRMVAGVRIRAGVSGQDPLFLGLAVRFDVVWKV